MKEEFEAWFIEQTKDIARHRPILRHAMEAAWLEGMSKGITMSKNEILDAIEQWNET